MRSFVGFLFFLIAACAPLSAHAGWSEFRLEPAGDVEVISFGRSVAIDEGLVAVGALVSEAPGRSHEGAVLVYSRDGDSGEWSEEAILKSDQQEPDELFGDRVAVSGDTIAVSAPEASVNDERRAGIVWVFRRDAGGEWMQSARIWDSTPEANEFFGIGIALQGNLLAVGEISRAEGERGTVSLFERSSPDLDDWRLAAVIEDPGLFPINDFGKAIALDGDSLLVGAPLADHGCQNIDLFACQNVNYGAAFLFRKDTESEDPWSLSGTIVDGNPMPLSGFGASLALEGSRAVVGAPTRPGDGGGPASGAVFVFEPDGDGGWAQAAKLGHPHGKAGLMFGESLALSGNRILVGVSGAPGDPERPTGAAYIFELLEDGWQPAGELFPPDGYDSERFGAFVAMEENLIISAAPGYGGGRGAVYAYSDSEARPAGAAYPPNGELADDTVVVHESGVMLGATRGTREEGFPVWIVGVDPPEDFPSPDFEPMGPTVNVGAAESRMPPEGSKYGLAIPVPDSADPKSISAFMGVSSADVLADGPVEGEIWMPMPGVYNADTGTYTVPLDMLSARGMTVTLAAPTFEIPETEDTLLPPSSSAGDIFFRPSCAIAAALRHDCRESDEELVEQHLDEAWEEFQLKGFKMPYIASRQFDFINSKFSFWEPSISQGEFLYAVFLDARNDWFCAQTGNRSIAMPGMIHFCFEYPLKMRVDENGERLEGLDTYIVRTIRHELFHTIQYSYAFGGDHWIMEGQATLASQAPLLQRNDSVTYMDMRDSLIAPRNGWKDMSPYKTQDFWKYYALHQDPPQGYDYLKEVMAAGNTTQAVDEAIRSLTPGSSLGQLYWEFVKNQAMEKTFPIEAEFAGRPCREERETVRSVLGLNYTGREPLGVERRLGPMSAELIRIGFWEYPRSREFIEDLHVEVEGPEHIQYKIYYKRTETIEEGLAPARKVSDFESECASYEENVDRNFARMELSDSEISNTVWVLIANTRYQAPGTMPGGNRYTLRVYHGEEDNTGR